jgi:succinate dehydrogenase / fumarate reductase cytochrome b subunit
VLSILHRITGVGLAAGFIVLVYWLAALGGSASSYTRAVGVLQTLPFQILFVGWIFAFFYHFANGIRHLAWDIGWGFEMNQVRKSGWTVVVFTVAATALTVAFLLGGWS